MLVGIAIEEALNRAEAHIDESARLKNKEGTRLLPLTHEQLAIMELAQSIRVLNEEIECLKLKS